MGRGRARSPTPRKQPTQARAVATFDAIVMATERALERYGARGLSTNHVAEIAGVSVGTLYQWFPNKEALIGVVVHRAGLEGEEGDRAVAVSLEKGRATRVEVFAPGIATPAGIQLDSPIGAVAKAVPFATCDWGG